MNNTFPGSFRKVQYPFCTKVSENDNPPHAWSMAQTIAVFEIPSTLNFSNSQSLVALQGHFWGSFLDPICDQRVVGNAGQWRLLIS